MKILVTGATSQIGTYLLSKLVASGHTCVAVSRTPRESQPGIQWICADLTGEMYHLWECGASVWIHLGFLKLLTSHLKAASIAGIHRVIAFSSTSIFTKAQSSSDKERNMIQGLLEAEAELQASHHKYGVAWTLFRPTMIYGCGQDQNIAFIQSMIGRLGIFPVAGGGKGLRQPVHAEDLAKACVQALSLEQTHNKPYNLSGGEILTYREMVERVFIAMECEPKVVSLPAWLYKSAIHVLKRISPKYTFVQTTMVDRMCMDMVFDHADAARDFAYHPRGFQPNSLK